MKNLLLFSILFFFASCQKSIEISDSSEDIEISDFNIETPDSPELETRAAARISSVEAEQVNTTCEKFQNYYKLKTESTTPFKIKGLGFGTTQGNSVIKCLFRDAKIPITCRVVSWSETEISVNIQAAPIETKNVPIWFRVEKDGKATNSKLLKCVGSISSTHFSQANWETALQRKKMNLSFFPTSTPQAINSAYTPTNGDVLSRSEGNTEAVIMSVGSTVLVNERNQACNGTIKYKKYTFRNGAFLPKSGETPFVKFSR